MELAGREPRSPYLGLYKRLGNIGVPAFGVILLFIVALQFWLATTWIGRLDLGAVTLGVAAIGLAYYKQRRALDQMDETINGEALARLYHAANAMACFGYMICIIALGIHH